MIAAGGVLLLVFAASPVQVVQPAGNVCPASADVELALGSMLTSPPGAAPVSRDVARLKRAHDALHVELADPQGGVIAERTVVSGKSCAKLAQITAIVIASWYADQSRNKIVRAILPTGYTEFSVPTASAAPQDIPDGNLWFTEGGGNKIGRITP